MLMVIGALTVGVVALGVYGMVAYAVRQSRQAIGVRTALGATRPVIVRYFLRQGMTLAAVGIAIGIIAALAVTRLMTTLLLGVAATDVTSFVAAGLVDKLAVFVAPILAGGDGPEFLPRLGSSYPLSHATAAAVGGDVLIQAYVHEP